MARKRPPAPTQAAQAAATKPAKNKAAPPRDADDPLALLRYEHRALESLFAQFGLRKERQLASRVCTNLTSHFKLEDAFYREAGSIPEIHGRVDTAIQEHGSMEDLMRAIGKLDEGDALNDEMLELQQLVEQHVREEERTIFPAVMKRLPRQELRQLGANLRAAKDKLSEPPTRGRKQARQGEDLTEEERSIAAR
ncbi:MAG TPA: hemerythrin domain-containing protein [Chloroflexota bacterium]|nr:hemerythrin domain-containing protein [Chloroflexota bacterium]